MNAKKEKQIKLPKVPSWLEQTIEKENDEYRYFKSKDKLAEKTTIELILKGSITGMML